MAYHTHQIGNILNVCPKFGSELLYTVTETLQLISKPDDDCPYVHFKRNIQEKSFIYASRDALLYNIHCSSPCTNK